MNVRSFTNKIDEIKAVMQSENIDILCITETWLHTDTANSHLQIDNYKIFRNDRSSRGGGTCIYVRDEYTAEQIYQNESHEDVQDVWLKIQIGKTKSVIIGALYRHPKGSANSFDYIENMLHTASNQSKSLYVLGDFNDNMLLQNKIGKNKIAKIIERLHLSQMIKEPTRITDNSATLIDLIITNEKSTILETEVTPSSFADHHDISCVINIKKRRDPLPTITTRTRKNYSQSAFQYELLENEHLFNEMYDTDDATKQCKIFTNAFNRSLNACAPIVTTKLTRPPASWMTDEIRSEIQLKKDLQLQYKDQPTTAKKKNCEAQNRKVRSIVMKAKRENNYKQLSDARKSHNMKQTWKILNSIVPHRPTKESMNLENLQEIAEIFNERFSTTGERVYQEVSSEYNKTNEHSCNPHGESSRTSTNDKLHEKKWSPEPISSNGYLKDAIFSLKNSKSTGEDGIALQYIKDSLVITLPYIRTMINNSISTNTFPEQLKHALIIPIHKSGSKSDPSNYRPISILSVLSKILEKVIAFRLMSYMQSNNLWHQNQYAYRSKTSTENALLNITEQIYKNIDDKKISLLLLLDLSKAFDSVNHIILLRKLGDMGVDSAWFESYLSNRTQSVKINNKIKSERRNTNFGVPQGSILGPILFLVFMNDISCGDPFKSNMTIYADDVQLLFSKSPKDMDQMKIEAETALTNIKQWYGRNGLKVNASKTQSIIIGSAFHLKNIPNNFQIVFEGSKLPLENKVKSLGVWFDTKLNFEHHIDTLCRKINGTLRYVHSRKSLLDEKSRLLIIQALIFSKIDYCQPIWGKCSKTLSNRLQKLMNFAAKVVCEGNYRKRDHVTPLMEKLQWLDIESRLALKEIIHVYKHINNLQGTSSLSFNESNNAKIRQPRHPERLQSTYRRTTMGQQAVSISGPIRWNALPNSVKTSKSIQSFKSKAKKHLLSNQFHQP